MSPRAHTLSAEHILCEYVLRECAQNKVSQHSMQLVCSEVSGSTQLRAQGMYPARCGMAALSFEHGMCIRMIVAALSSQHRICIYIMVALSSEHRLCIVTVVVIQGGEDS